MLLFLTAFFTGFWIHNSDRSANKTEKAFSSEQVLNEGEDSVERLKRKLPKTGLPVGHAPSFFYDYPKSWREPVEVERSWMDTMAIDNFARCYDTCQKYYQDTALIDESKFFYLILTDRWLDSWHRHLLTISKKGEVIDKLDLVGPEIWSRNYMEPLFFIDRKGIIYIKDFLVQSEAELTYYIGERSYKIHSSGYFMPYHKQKTGIKEVNFSFATNSYDTSFIWKERGTLKNHVKMGIWEEIKFNYNLKYITPSSPAYFNTTYVQAYYVNGLADGIWDYYNVELNDIGGYFVHSDRKGENLLMRETYELGKLIKREIFDDPLDRKAP